MTWFVSHTTGHNRYMVMSRWGYLLSNWKIVWSNASEKSLNFFSHSYHTCTTNYNLNTSLQTAFEAWKLQTQLKILLREQLFGSLEFHYSEVKYKIKQS